MRDTSGYLLDELRESRDSSYMIQEIFSQKYDIMIRYLWLRIYVPFEDRLGMLVDIEYSNRKNNRQKRLIRNAGFDQPEASIMDINYTSGRKLNKDLINRLATCEYISEHRNLFITGATGCGKTYMACAFGMEACKQYYNTRYVRMPDLLMDLDVARSEGTYRKVMAKYANPVLLILDEWMLLKPTDTEQKDIFELLHRRHKKSSTIFCSQYVFEEWVRSAWRRSKSSG